MKHMKIYCKKKKTENEDENVSPNWISPCHQPEILKQKKIVHTTTNSELMLKGKLGCENKK